MTDGKTYCTACGRLSEECVCVEYSAKPKEPMTPEEIAHECTILDHSVEAVEAKIAAAIRAERSALAARVEELEKEREVRRKLDEMGVLPAKAVFRIIELEARLREAMKLLRNVKEWGWSGAIQPGRMRREWDEVHTFLAASEGEQA